MHSIELALQGCAVVGEQGSVPPAPALPLLLTAACTSRCIKATSARFKRWWKYVASVSMIAVLRSRKNTGRGHVTPRSCVGRPGGKHAMYASMCKIAKQTHREFGSGFGPEKHAKMPIAPARTLTEREE
jgi:hypothetical protein